MKYGKLLNEADMERLERRSICLIKIPMAHQESFLKMLAVLCA